VPATCQVAMWRTCVYFRRLGTKQAFVKTECVGVGDILCKHLVCRCLVEGRLQVDVAMYGEGEGRTGRSTQEMGVL
jgi:hypothetical protein